MNTTLALIGDTVLTLETARMARGAGLHLALIITRSAPLRALAAEEGIALLDPDRLEDLPGGIDWLLSAGNLDVLPAAVLERFARGAINFHDGPLPERVGRNVPVWALLDGARRHAITWHLMTPGVDAGDILVRRGFDVAGDATARSLNALCFAAAIESLPEVFEQMQHGLRRRPQPAAPGQVHRAADRPAADALIDGRGPVAQAWRLVHALDHGAHPNPLCCPKIAGPRGPVLVRHAEMLEATQPSEAPGMLRAVSAEAMDLVFEDGVLRLSGLCRPDGSACPPEALPSAGDRLPETGPAEALTLRMAQAARAEPDWRARLEALRPHRLPGLLRNGGPEGETTGGMGDSRTLESDHAPDRLIAAWALMAARLSGGAADITLMLPPETEPVAGHVSDWVPLRVVIDPREDLAALASRIGAQCAALRGQGGFAADLPARLGMPLAMPAFALGEACPEGATVALDPETGQLHAAPGALMPGALDLLAERLAVLLDADAAQPGGAMSVLPALGLTERHLVLEAWNATDGVIPEGTIDTAIAHHAAENPGATALICGDERLSHAELDARANRMARVLRDMGAGPGQRIGLHLRRSAGMVVAALAVLKTGAAYVPLDPSYPPERLALYLEDSDAALVISDAGGASALPQRAARVLHLDDPRIAQAASTPLAPRATPEDLAYLIFTSGSTGRPKGVMIEHRHVMNFFAAMDARVPHAPGDVLLAVTSISFDISVLELFWTLSRGLTVVIQGEAERLLTSSGAQARTAGPSLSLFYWGHEDGDGADYRLLMEGARFADAHGFEAVWTPERHFHGFGAAYPNPAVTGAAVAAVTSRVAIRAGSCVAPLHHPARIAEDWAVVDRLSGGRAGLAMAAGWQPGDFVLRPENAPPDNRTALRDSIDAVRKLWRGEAVAFPRADGSLQEVVTRPRPVSAELPLWLTIAGNPESWREAGRIGANVLTHLLGQSVEDLGARIADWRAALAEAGHDPANFRVTVMLHAYLDETREAAREAARGPMKAYLRSAAGLIASHAAAFPAIRRGADGAIDPDALTPDEMEAVLDHAFERYFEDQGLFGTVRDGAARLAQLRAAGADEIACLIDFGIAPERVLAALPRLAALNDALAAAPVAEDASIAAQIHRHGVTHLQCTPSMARMLVADEVSRAALGRLSRLLLGGEALPAALAEDLRAAGVSHLENMYGPTETTIWSTTRQVTPEAPAAVIGTPILNTRTYVLDDAMTPLPVGVEGELWIGGAGVARGYWARPDLTAERFRADPFRPGERIYRTGDLARWRADGTLEYLGRADSQVKLRGHRIELGEIEAALDAVSGFGPCVVVLREDAPGDARLVAYLETDAASDEGALRASLTTRLPAIMVPARIVALPRFPLTPNRKTDRAAMPPPARRSASASRPIDATRARAKAASVVSASPIVKAGTAAPAIAAIWRELLGTQDIGPNDSFFDLGGHSLLAVRAHREIRDRLGVTGLQITDIFGLPRLSDLAARIEADLTPEPMVPPMAALTAAGQREEMMARRRALRARRTGHV